MNTEPTSLHDVSNLSILFHLRQVIQEHVSSLLKRHLEIPQLVNQANLQAIASQQLDWQDLDALRSQFFQQMKLFPNLSGIQWGNREGDYVGILDLGNRTPTLELKQHRSGLHKYAYALDEWGTPTDTCLGLAYNYDPRERPWYQCADAGNPGWSPVYQYSSDVSVQLGVMAVCPASVAGQQLGVLGCDVALTHISQVLNQLSATLMGTYFLLERDGHLIGSSVHTYPFTIRGGQAQRLKAQVCGVPLIEAATEQLLQQCEQLGTLQTYQQFQYYVAGQLYFLDVQPLPAPLGLDWLVVTCLSAAEILPHTSTEGAHHLVDSLSSLKQTNENLLAQVRRHAAALQASNQALQLSEERWQLALQGTNDGLWDWHLDTNEVFFSERWQQISGYQAGELAHHLEEWKQRIHPEDRSRVDRAIAAHLNGDTEYYHIEHRTYCKDGSYKWILDRGRALWDETGRPVRMVGSRSDITARKRMESRLIFQAEHDALTGLLNRAALTQKIHTLLARSQPHFTLLLADIDRFKAVNDSLGHAIGDQLIVHFAESLKQVFEAEDIVARLSGDEFVIVIEGGLAPSAIARLVGQIKTNLQAIASALNLCTPIAVSIGVTSTELSQGQPQDILRDADLAMYTAKKAGGNRYVEFSPVLREQSAKALTLESALKYALENQEFVLHFQPILRLQNQTLVGMEALVRWQHPERGLISPGEFIPIAEKTGLILDIGKWILESACQHLQAWQAGSPHFSHLALNINVSMQQFYQPDFVDNIDHLIATYGLAAHKLRLEITESCFMESTELAVNTMQALHQRQIPLCIDDFGTGYSSLSYLHKLPVEFLKIDQSFVSRIVDSDQGTAMVKAILAMSQSLGIKVVAEGIETSQQMSKLQKLGCEFGQGYLFSKPRDARGLEAWIERFAQASWRSHSPLGSFDLSKERAATS